MREKFCFNLDPKIVEQVDEKRGEMIPRSRMVEHLIKRGLEAGELVPPLAN